MKKLLVIAGLLVTASAVLAQGSLTFANLSGGVNAPITKTDGTRIVGPGSFVADLFYSTDLAAVPNPLGSDSFTAAGFNQIFSTSTSGGGGGWFLGGVKTLTGVTGTIVAQVRVWDTAMGATYTAARSGGGQFGFSNPVNVVLATGSTPPPSLTGLAGFQLQIVPEPSTLALAGLGLAGLLIFRRRQ